jgi:hypothetical protein
MASFALARVRSCCGQKIPLLYQLAEVGTNLLSRLLSALAFLVVA